MERIVSRRHPVVRQFREAAASDSECVLLDGEHLLEEALDEGVEVDVVAFADRASRDSQRALVERARQHGARIVHVREDVLEAMSPVKRPSGLVALARLRAASLDAALAARPQLVLVLHGIQDPGNVGAIIRAADAFGATGIVTSEETAAPLGWKALRGSMGSAFRVPVACGQPLETAIASVRARGARLHAATPGRGTPLHACDLRGPAAILLGSEGGGLPVAAMTAADERLTIPVRPPVDSLNVGAAAAIILYEAHRQRTAGTP